MILRMKNLIRASTNLVVERRRSNVFRHQQSCLKFFRFCSKHCEATNSCKRNGFTLIELILTLFLAALVLTVGVPNFQETMRDNRMVTQTNALVTALNIARSEAIKRSVRITVCKSKNQSTCSGDAEWENGWIVFSDQDKDGTFDGAPEEVISTSAGLSGNNTLRTNANFSNFITFTSSGESRGNPGNSGTFSLCDARGATKGRAILINDAGQIRTEKGAVACP